jgi:hypothetical protein
MLLENYVTVFLYIFIEILLGDLVYFRSNLVNTDVVMNWATVMITSTVAGKSK